MSYNIWFSEEDRMERTISLIENIKENNPDVICMQEVTKPVFDYLIKNFKNYPYHYPTKPNKNYDCMIFSKFVISKAKEFVFKNSSMDRKIIATLLNINVTSKEKNNLVIENFPLVVATCHFESLFKAQNQVKIEQFETAKTILENLLKSYGPDCPIIFCADTNIMPKEESYYITNDNYWKDCWIESGGDKHNKFTYDTILNENLKNRNIGVIRSRIDRIIYNDIDELQLLSFRLIKGNENYIEPSDHFGIMAEIGLNKN